MAVRGAGYAAVTIDFHGSTGYGQAFTDAINRDWGGAPLEDLRLGLAAAGREHPGIDVTNACALGGSYGGFMTNWIAGNWPDGFRCLVSHSGIFDQRAMATAENCGSRLEFGGPYYVLRQQPLRAQPTPVNFVQNFRTRCSSPRNGTSGSYSHSLGLFHAPAAQHPSRGWLPDENHWILRPA